VGEGEGVMPMTVVRCAIALCPHAIECKTAAPKHARIVWVESWRAPPPGNPKRCAGFDGIANDPPTTRSATDRTPRPKACQQVRSEAPRRAAAEARTEAARGRGATGDARRVLEIPVGAQVLGDGGAAQRLAGDLAR